MAKHTTQNVGVAAAALDLGASVGQTFDRDRNVVLKPAATISIGGPGVTVANGLVVAAGATVFLGDIKPPLYAIAPVATSVVILTD